MDKKGFEVAINFIVMLILAISVFSLGLIFVRNIFQQAGEISADLNKQQEQQIERLLDRGDRVAIPFASKETEPGTVAVFGVGILNYNADPTTFNIQVTCNVALDVKDIPIDVAATGCNNWAFGHTALISLDKNQKTVVSMGILPPKGAQRGTYGFSVNVLMGTEEYDKPKLVYVTIP